MCGIIGSVGKCNHYQMIIDGLKLLEYRGYDSSGVGYLVDGKIEVIKSIGKVKNLEKKLKKFNASAAIGHTRWATHGKISKENTHPFISNHGIFSLVHNGTIDNFLELKKELIINGYFFHGETDSEVVVNYLEYLYLLNEDMDESLFLLDKKLSGSYSLVILFNKENRIYFLKNQTSLLISKIDNGYLISSDLYAFNQELVNYYEIEDHQYGCIDQNDVKIFQNKNNIKLKFKRTKISSTRLIEHECYLEKEILETPELIEKQIEYYTLMNGKNIPSRIIKKLKEATKITILACGTSYHAGLIMKRLWKNKNIDVILASEFDCDTLTQYDENSVFILISQSGETFDLIKVHQLIKDHYVLGITNNVNSRIARLVDDHLNIMMEKEISVASTKAYFGEVIMLYLLINKINKLDNQDLLLLPEYLKKIIERKKEIITMAKQIKKYPSLYFIGKGIDHDISLETSLKLKEITYIHSEAICLGELKHGPLSLINKKFPVILIDSGNVNKEAIKVAKNEIISRNGIIFQLDTYNEYLLNFLVEVYWGDLLALYVGKKLKVNLDKPRNLAKSVTVE